MPSKNSINRPKNKNTARAKAQHKSAVARRTPQTAIIHGKVDSRKVAQKKLRRARLAQGLEAAAAAAEAGGDIVMQDEGEQVSIAGIDTKAKKEARKAKIVQEKQAKENEERGAREFKMSDGSTKGTTLGGPPQ